MRRLCLFALKDSSDDEVSQGANRYDVHIILGYLPYLLEPCFFFFEGTPFLFADVMYGSPLMDLNGKVS